MFVRRLALVIGLLCGFIGTQWPEFSQQYRQRLGGALDELRRVVAAFDAEAASRSLTPAEGVARLKDNADPLARERGADIESDIAREARLEREIAELQGADPLRRLVVMARRFRFRDRRPDVAGLPARGSRHFGVPDRRRHRAHLGMGRDASLRLADSAPTAGASRGERSRRGVRRSLASNSALTHP